MPTVSANGININYEVQGEGQPLILISGLGYGLWQWHKMIPGLARRFRVIAFDNRGAGGTDKPAGPYSADMLGRDTAGLIEALGLGPCLVVGHSMGGFIAQWLAVNRPELVKGLVLASTNFGGPHHVPITPEAMAVIMDRSGDPIEVVRRGIAIACAPGFSEAHPDVVQEIVSYRLTGPVPPEAYQAQMGVGMGLLSAEAAFEGRLSAYKGPALILFGEHDKVVPVGNADLLKGQLPQAEVVILPGCGHVFPLETPEQANEAIVKALG